jgi:hypothetical protein
MPQIDALNCELEMARKIFWLLSQDAIFLTGFNSELQKHDDGAYPAINCNDLFVPGGDAESLHSDDIDLFIDVIKQWPMAGCSAWCVHKRNINLWRMPNKPEWVAEYNGALDYLKLKRCLHYG